LPTEDITVFVAMEGESAAVANSVYSLEEQVVGTWIDGKPIYRTVFFCGNAVLTNSKHNNLFNVSSLNLDSVSKYEGTLIHHAGDGDYIVAMPADGWNLYITPNKALSVVPRGGSANVSNVYLTLEYTKTTDTATAAIPSATALMDAYEEGVNEA
jgi:hypothetical protein